MPWLGYLSKLAHSDVFVILDNVQFRKRHFYDRTQIIDMHGNVSWLRLPVGENFGTLCLNVKLHRDRKRHVEKMINTVAQSYAKARSFQDEWPDIKNILHYNLFSHENLVDLNVHIIRDLLELLSIPCPEIILSSTLIDESCDPSSRIRKICKKVGVKTIILGSGSSLDVHDWEWTSSGNIRIEIQDYLSQHPEYFQTRRQRVGFQKGLSTIDAILNIGRSCTREHIINEIYAPIPHPDILAK